MSEDKLFSPEFVFEICVGLAIHDFLCKDLPMANAFKTLQQRII